MLYYFGICLTVWLLVGFVMGLKMVFVDKVLTKEKLEAAKKQALMESRYIGAFDVAIKSKLNFIVFMTLCGFIPLVIDIYSMVKRHK